ncbi:MAG: sigma-54 dependent transcriptional regulator [Pseudomonadota bacterium]
MGLRTQANRIVLVVDDEPDIRELLSMTISGMGIEAVEAASVRDAERQLKERAFDLCLTDMRLPDGDGLALVSKIQDLQPGLPVAVITAHGSVESAVTALKNGAFDFLSKPLDLNNLRNIVSTALQLGSDGSEDSTVLIGQSDVMNQVRDIISRVARSQAPVHIRGESGTGKELVARMIHEASGRRDQAFVPVNCGAIPHELMESELFGHRKGSFTGAVSDKEGLFQAADGGTLFLDEIAELPLPMQVKLLRVIQEKKVRPVGAAAEQPVDVRILSATHQDLAALSKAQSFREDLFYRVNVIELPVPPLRDRGSDVALLANRFLEQFADQHGVGRKTLTSDARAALSAYPFPGNVRELENIIERAVTLTAKETLDVDDLRLEPPSGSDTPAVSASPMGATASPVSVDGPLTPQLEDVERQAIREALEKTRYNKTAAAKLLGLTFRQLRYRIKKLGIE